MKKRTFITMALALTMCSGAFIACDNSGNPPPKTDNSPITNETEWESAINLTGLDYKITYYGKNYGANYEGVLIVDGENRKRQETMLDSTMVDTIIKEGDKYYTFADYTYWNSYAHQIYNWGNYYSKVETTQTNKYNDFHKFVFDTFELEFSDFEWDKDSKKYKATGLSSSQTGEKTYSVSVGFDENDRLYSLDMVQENVDAPDYINFNIEYGDMTVTAPVGVVTYPMSGYQSEFDLNYENYVCVYEEYSMGYVYPTSFKIEKAGTKIRLSEKSSVNDDFRTPTYYDKEGENFYKYSKSGEVWNKTQITETEYNGVVNKVKTTVLAHNSLYSFSNLADSSNNFYYLFGNSNNDMLSFFCVDNKIVKIVAGPLERDASKGPKAQFNFEYGVAQVVIPETLPVA